MLRKLVIFMTALIVIANAKRIRSDPADSIQPGTCPDFVDHNTVCCYGVSTGGSFEGILTIGRYEIHVGRAYLAGEGCGLIHYKLNAAVESGISDWQCDDEGTGTHGQTFLNLAVKYPKDEAWNINAALAEVYPDIRFNEDRICKPAA